MEGKQQVGVVTQVMATLQQDLGHPWGMPLMPSWLTWNERPASAARQSWTLAMHLPSNHSFSHCLCASQAHCSRTLCHTWSPPVMAYSPGWHFLTQRQANQILFTLFTSPIHFSFFALFFSCACLHVSIQYRHDHLCEHSLLRALGT